MMRFPQPMRFLAMRAAVAVVVTVTAMTAGDGLAQRPSPGGSDVERRSLGDYDLLTRRNIFLSTRRAGMDRPPETAPATAPAPPPPVYDERGSWVLRGVLADATGCVAAVEHRATGELRWIRPGDEAFGRRVTAVDLDGMSLAEGTDDTVEVAVGSLLSGDPPDVGSPAGGAPGAAPAADPATESVLERLRRRRMQEMEQTP